MITIVADQNIPFLGGALESFARIKYLPGNSIRKEDLAGADGLIIRTRTRCDAELLEGTPVKFIATATIGHDHIDKEYCSSKGIQWHHAAGCNASGVQHYMASALLTIAKDRHITLREKTLGIIGAGNVGSKVESLAKTLGIRVLLNDPPRERIEGKGIFTGIRQLLEESDFISLHVPLNPEGEDKTYHLLDEVAFSSMKPDPIIINTSRGPVVDEKALKKTLLAGKVSGCILDVWENEPDLDRDLLDLVSLGTPHIAGYSTEGKANGAAYCVQQASRFFGFGIDHWFPDLLPSMPNNELLIDPAAKSVQEIVTEAVLFSYDIRKDDHQLRQRPEGFEQLRNEYPVRREPAAFTIKLSKPDAEAVKVLQDLGFRTE